MHEGFSKPSPDSNAVFTLWVKQPTFPCLTLSGVVESGSGIKN